MNGTNEAKNGRPRGGSKFRAKALFVLISGLFALGCIFTLCSHTEKVGPFKLKITIRPTPRHGRTELALNPFGRISARTHPAPVAVALTIQDVSLREAKAFVSEGSHVSRLMRLMRRGAARMAAKFLLKLLLIGFLGGALGAALGHRLALKRLLAGGGVGVCAALLLLASVAAGFNFRAFNNLQYSGAIGEIQSVLPGIKGIFNQGVAFKDRLNRVAKDLAEFYVRNDVEMRRRGQANFIRVLHISDLHNNPIAAEMVCKLNDSLSPDIIVDTGDMTDLGQPLELNMVGALACLKKPHLFVSGNHDLPESVAEMKRRFNVIALDGNTVEAGGLRIMGFGFPLPFGDGAIGTALRPADVGKLDAQIRAALKAAPQPPDILMFHDPQVAERFAGSVPVILDGHTHEASAKVVDGSLVVNSGTTGASGIRYFLKGVKPRYSVALITFEKKDGRAVPLFADIITMNENTGDFSVVRTEVKK